MPYKSNYRRTRRRKALNPKAQRAVKSIVKKTMKQDQEWKHFIAESVGAVDNTLLGSCFSLTDVPQGDTDVTRDGDMLQASSLGVNCFFTSADVFNNCRVIIFQWYPESIPQKTDILNNTGITNAHQSPYNTDKAAQFKILWDHVYTLNTTHAAASVSSRVIRKKLRIPRPKMQFTATSTIGTNKLYYLAVTDSGSVAHPSINLVTRLNFRDN